MRERKLPTPEEHQRLTTLCLSAVICALVVSIVVELGHRGFDAMKLPPASFAGAISSCRHPIDANGWWGGNLVAAGQRPQGSTSRAAAAKGVMSNKELKTLKQSPAPFMTARLTRAPKPNAATQAYRLGWREYALVANLRAGRGRRPVYRVTRRGFPPVPRS
jgi:hypothetical protein